MDFGGEKLPEKLTRTVLQFPNLILKLHVKLKNDNGNVFHSEYAYGDNNYINLNVNGFLTLEIPKTKEDIYDPTRSFLIGVGNIGIVIKHFKNVLKNIYTKDLFVIQNNKIVPYNDVINKCTEQITIPRSGQSLLLKPAVIYDENETSYEGVVIYVNNTNNMIQLSFEEFENFTYLLDKFDIFNASQLLLNYYISYISSKDKIKQISHKNNYNQIKNIDWNNKTTSNFREDKTDIFDGLNQ